MDAHLDVVSGPFAGHKFHPTSGKFLIGREGDCQCVLDELSVSRHHCVLILDEWTLRIRDLNCKNGTFRNDDRLGPYEVVLADGDIISVGPWVARVGIRRQGSPASPTVDDSPATKFLKGDTTQLGEVAPRGPKSSKCADEGPLENRK